MKNVATLLTFLVVTWVSSAHGQSNEPQPVSAASRSPGCACRLPGAYLHDGFYARTALGLQYMSLFGENATTDASINGFGPSLAVLVGGTPVHGLAVGGILRVVATEADFNGAPAGASQDARASLPLVGAFVDVHPNPKGPWHTGAALGLGGFSGRDLNHTKYIGFAPTAYLFTGYDAWLNPQYAAGISLTAQGALPARAGDLAGDLGYKFASLSAGIELSLLFH